MIRALLYNRATDSLRDLDKEQILATMPLPADTAGLSAAGPSASAQIEDPEERSTHGRATACHPDELMWIDISDPEAADYDLLAERFALHPMVVEDINAREGRPKLHDYGDYLYIVFHAVKYGLVPDRAAITGSASGSTSPTGPPAADAKADPPRFQLDITEIDVLVGADYVITIHYGEVEPFKDLYGRWKRRPSLMKSGAPYLLYEIMDEVLDDYFPLLDSLDERIDEFEDRLFREFEEHLSADIFALKRCLVQIRRIAGPTRDVANLLLRHDTDAGGSHFAYFQDLYDHASRIVESIDTFRDLLAGALDAYLTMASNRMNAIMKTLTAASIILLVPTLIAGIYGMNFTNMPELQSPNGYHAALMTMGAIIVALTLFFKRKKWL
jgi:magnesium transporter